MIITRTVTKKVLENIVHETFSKLGVFSSCSLLDSLKLLGFYYATNAGISINIEDLKIPTTKKNTLQTVYNEIEEVSKQWQQGFVSDIERFQNIIDSWNLATESLKNRIVDYYQIFDPANNLYIMAFSGARGNMSQVRQLVGMRGLMSDQEGNIIDLPIQANFREGLSSIDYIVSSYGARKGIVDTALKTANSGYLTRRLIYVAQDLIIREINCFTKTGLIVILKKNINNHNLVGRIITNCRRITYPYLKIYKEDLILDIKNLKNLKKIAPLILTVRSPLTCKSNSSICQKCYGWDLSKENLISLGEAVGVIAAQSIGEPGTQLTMRTFHTGGIFTSETLKQISAPFSGKIIIPKLLKTIFYRTLHGAVILKLQQEGNVTIVNWKGQKKNIFLESGSYLYLETSSFVKKGQLIAEYFTQSFDIGTETLKPICASITGKIFFESFKNKLLLSNDIIMWIASTKTFVIPKETKYKFPKFLKKNRPFATLKIITPFSGIFFSEESFFTIKNEQQKVSFNFLDIKKRIRNCSIKFVSLLKNYQYVDTYTTLYVIELYPKYEELEHVDERIYSVLKNNKEIVGYSRFFFITESDIWKVTSDQVNNFNLFLEKEKKIIVCSKDVINATSKLTRFGLPFYQNGFQLIFQNATPKFLGSKTVINYKDFVLKGDILAKLITYTQQTEDIVQSLPKIEKLVEARLPKNECILSKRSGIILDFSTPKKLEVNLTIPSFFLEFKLNKNDKFLKIILIGHNYYSKKIICSYNEQFYTIKENIEKYFSYIDLKQDFVDQLGSNFEDQSINSSYLFLYKNYKKVAKLTIINDFVKKVDPFLIDKEQVIIKPCTVNTVEFGLLSLEPIIKLATYYNTCYNVNNITAFERGNFVDIGEPITKGNINIHNLLTIFFNYHLSLDGTEKGTKRAFTKIQLILVNSIQAIYQSQGVTISSKHIEIIIRQMTSFVRIKKVASKRFKKIISERFKSSKNVKEISKYINHPLINGEIVKFSQVNEICKAYYGHNLPTYEPLLLSITKSSLLKTGFLSSAGFQQTKRVLTRAAVEGSLDWLRGLKECIISGRLIPAGSAFLNYKNYLDNIYLFKK